MVTQTLEYDYSNLSDTQVRQNIAILTVLSEQAKTALDAVKMEAVRRDMGKTEPEHITINGEDAGAFTYSKPTEPSYYVADPAAFAQYLARSGFENMPEETLMPASEALAKSFITARVNDELVDTVTGVIMKDAGELPDGVKQRAGRGETVTFRRNKAVTEHLFELLTPMQVIEQITAGNSEGEE